MEGKMKKYGSQSEYIKNANSFRNNPPFNKKIKDSRYFNSRVFCQILPKVRAKQKLTVDEQIDYMKFKGITFNIIDESAAKSVLTETNYYYKLSVARKLFEKGFNDKYKLLDFSFLVDLSSIDMGIRYFLLQMTLDIEHSIKVALIDELTKNPKIDPYLIVQQFKNKNKNFYKNIIGRFSKTEYKKDMYSKRGKDIPYWVLLEIMDMGGLIKFLNFYTSKFKATTTLSKTSEIALFAKNIRNCCAHSSAFIYNVYDPQTRILSNPRMITYGERMGINSNDIQFRKINDLVALFYLHKIFCTDLLNNRRVKEGKIFLERCDRNRIYYSSNKYLKKEREIFIKLLDYLNN